MPLRSDIIGVVLAGGASSRMGTDKALLPLGGAPIITYAAKALSSVFSEVVVSSGSGKRYAFLGLNEISDVFNDSGPLGGIPGYPGAGKSSVVSISPLTAHLFR